MKKSLIILILSLSCGVGILYFFFNNSDNFEESKIKIPDFTLFTLDKKAFRLYEKKDVRGIVLFTYGIGCPIAQQNLPYLFHY